MLVLPIFLYLFFSLLAGGFAYWVVLMLAPAHPRRHLLAAVVALVVLVAMGGLGYWVGELIRDGMAPAG